MCLRAANLPYMSICIISCPEMTKWFIAEGAGGPAQVTDEQAGGSSLSAFEAGYLHAATAMGIRRGEGTLPATSYAGPPRSGPENWSQQR